MITNNDHELSNDVMMTYDSIIPLHFMALATIVALFMLLS